MDELLAYLLTLHPIVGTVFLILGLLVTVAVAVDAAIDDTKDKGFSKKMLAIPILGPLLKALTKFSPFNNRDKEKK